MVKDGRQPNVIVLAGPNGAGKSTAAPSVLNRALGVVEFVNADVIALGLSAFRPESVAFAAGRIMLRRLDELLSKRSDFALETTLASQGLEKRLRCALDVGYQFHLLFFWLPGAELAVERVAKRVRSGGHHVPDETVRRRYNRGIENFFEIYQPLATSWGLYDSSGTGGPQPVASGRADGDLLISDGPAWAAIRKAALNE